MAKSKKKRPKKTDAKAVAQRIHFKNRIKERFGLDVNREDMQNIVLQIQSGNAIMIHKQSNRVSVHSVWIHGQWVPVVYDKERKTLVTALQENWVEIN